MQTLSLTRSASVTLNGTGAGTVQLGPSITNEQWLPTSVSVFMTGAAPMNLATVFLYTGGSTGPNTFVDSTYDVTSASSSMISGQVIWPGQYIYATWAGGNASATATMIVQGTRRVP